jgi:predicted phage tail component-like protein
MIHPRTIFNGNLLEEKIPGFKTLNVIGREMIGRENTTQKIGGKDGVSYVESTLPHRILTVKYWIKANDYEELKTKFELLNYYLDVGQADVTFTDDLDYKWTGILDSVGNIEGYTNFKGSTFDVMCSDPYKYSTNIKTLKGTSNLEFRWLNRYPILPEQIILNVKTAGDKINLKNITVAKSIILDEVFEIGDDVIIDFTGDEITIKKNGMNILNKMDLTSNLEDFLINYKDVISTNLAADITLKFRDRRK